MLMSDSTYTTRFALQTTTRRYSTALLLWALTLPVAAQPSTSETDPDADVHSTQDRSPHHRPDKHHDNAWINSIGTLLYSDDDLDSYHSGLSLTIDADTSYHNLEVYVAIDLTGPDQQTQRLHTTADFHVYRTSLSDEYRVDIDLVRNYIPAYYDVSLSLFDAHTDQSLDRVSGREFSNLRHLPLESEEFDLPASPPQEPPHNPHPDHQPHPQPVNDNVRVVEYGGGAGLAFLLLLTGLTLSRMAARRQTHQ